MFGMLKRRRMIPCILLLIFSLGSLCIAGAQTVAPAAQSLPGSSIAFRRAQHLRHGINASEWFAQRLNYSIDFLNTYTDPSDLRLMKQMGFDHVRMSIDPSIFECQQPWERCERVRKLDSIVDQILAEGMAVLIDIHPSDEFKKKLSRDNDAVVRFGLLWSKIAAHYADRDPERTFFELLNEPEFDDAYRWAGAQEQIARMVRNAAPNDTIILAGAMYSDIYHLLQLPASADHNVIYNFHYYEPFVFTHQGASWTTPTWPLLRHVPYPPSTEALQPLLNSLPDDTLRWQVLEYGLGHWNYDRIRQELAFAAQWAKQHDAPIICDEFGAYRQYVDPADRVHWISDMRRALEANGIGWTMWDYRGGFGVVRKDQSVNNNGAVVDQDVLHALGLGH